MEEVKQLLEETSYTILFLLGITMLMILVHFTEQTINSLRHNLYHGICVMYEEELE